MRFALLCIALLCVALRCDTSEKADQTVAVTVPVISGK